MNESNPLFEAIQQVMNGMELQMPDAVLPDPSVVSYYVFENERKIFLETEVCSITMEIIKLILRWNMQDKGIPVEQRKPITLYIMSGGGSLDYMWSLVDVMLASSTPIHTVNLGVAASAAALIFMAGSKRLMMPTATVIIHEGSAEMAGDANKLLDAANNYKEEIKKMHTYILSRTQIPSAVLNKRKKDDWYIDSKLCKEYSVCTDVISSLDEII